MAKNEQKLPDGLSEAENQAAAESGEAAGTGADAPDTGKSKKKRLILIAAAALVAIGGGGGAYFAMSGGDPKAEGDAAHEEADASGEEGVENFVDIPPLTVNLRTADGVSRYLKVHVMLVPGKAANDAITKKLPLVLDSYQPFMRELRPEDLAGSAATFRIKEELLVRANAALGPGAVRDVLIQDLVEQ